MAYAQIDFEVMQELDGVRLSLYLAVRHEEYLDGVCKLSAAELSRKYKKLKNESNTARIRKQMIVDGWLIQAVGGLITKSFNTTANFAVPEEKTAKFAVVEAETLQNLQDTAKNAVFGAEIEEEKTAKFAGTEIANKDLELKSLITIKDSYESYVRLSANDEALRDAICSKVGEKKKTDPITPVEWSLIAQVFDAWKTIFAKNNSTRLTTARGRAVLDRIRSFQNFTIAEFKQAILGCKNSPNHNGSKPGSIIYDDLELICRTDDHLARFIGYQEAVETLGGKQNGTSIQSNTNGHKNGNGKSNAQIIRGRDYSKFKGIDPTKAFGT
jgi:hypothetical protein